MNDMKGAILDKLLEFFSKLENESGEKDMGESMPGHEEGESMGKELGEQPKGKIEMLSIQAKPKEGLDKLKGC